MDTTDQFNGLRLAKLFALLNNLSGNIKPVEITKMQEIICNIESWLVSSGKIAEYNISNSLHARQALQLLNVLENRRCSAKDFDLEKYFEQRTKAITAVRTFMANSKNNVQYTLD